MLELTRYQDGRASVVVSRDGDELVVSEDFDDGGRSIVTASRILVDDFLAKGEGPWPWFELSDGQRAGALLVTEALGVDRPAWTEPLAPETLELFTRASRGSASISELLDVGDPDPLDPCGATPLWYAVRALSPEASLTLLVAGADAGRRVDLSARNQRYTTPLHEIVRLGRPAALEASLAHGVDPSSTDSEGAQPLHCLTERSDHVNPDLVRALVASGARIDAPTPDGATPIALAARRLLPATVQAMVDLGADPQSGLDAVVRWWGASSRHHGHRAKEAAAVIDVLRSAGATTTEEHRDLLAAAPSPAIKAALRRRIR